jgi:small subunit ribosomal protein S18
MEKKEITTKKEERGAHGIHFDYKNVALLSKYINPHARMHGRKRTSLTGREQRLLAQSIKRARFMALMPYIAR